MLCLTVTKFVDVPLETLAAQILLFIFFVAEDVDRPTAALIEWPNEQEGKEKKKKKKQLMFGCVEQVFSSLPCCCVFGCRKCPAGLGGRGWASLVLNDGTLGVEEARLQFFLKLSESSQVGCETLGFFFTCPPLTGRICCRCLSLKPRKRSASAGTLLFQPKQLTRIFFFPLPFFGFWN